MTTANDITALRARVAALGYELLTNDKGEQFVMGGGPTGTEVLFIKRETDGNDADLGRWLDEVERNGEWWKNGSTEPDAANHDELYNAARAVTVAVRMARARDWPRVALENDGGYADADELQVALERLCAVVHADDAGRAIARDESGADALRRAADRCREVAAQAKTIAAGGTIADALEPAELPAVTVLKGDLTDTLYGLAGLARMIDRDEPHDRETRGLSASALLVLAERVYSAMGACPHEVKDALEGVAEVHQ